MSRRIHKGRPCTDQCDHGSASTYGNHGCRCEQCRAAFAAAHLEYRVRVAEARRSDPATPHGHISTYTNWQCRCRPCKDANARYGRNYAPRRRANNNPQ